MIEVEIFISGPLRNNTYLIFDEKNKEGILIDPSFEVNKIIDFVEEEEIKIEWLLFTHGHYDHLIGLKKVLELLPDLKIGMNYLDLPIVKNFSTEKALVLGVNLVFKKPDIDLSEGERLEKKNLSCLVIHTPGHTPGGVCFYFKEQNLIFTGDTLFRNAIGRTDLLGGSFNTLVNSIKNKLLILPEITIIYPGHGKPTTISDAKKYWQKHYG